MLLKSLITCSPLTFFVQWPATETKAWGIQTWGFLPFNSTDAAIPTIHVLVRVWLKDAALRRCRRVGAFFFSSRNRALKERSLSSSTESSRSTESPVIREHIAAHSLQMVVASWPAFLKGWTSIWFWQSRDSACTGLIVPFVYTSLVHCTSLPLVQVS